MTPEESLELNFKETLKLPDDAVMFLMDLWNAIQVFDDVADGDEVKRADLNKAVWASLAGIQLNAFYAANMPMLMPVVSLQIVKWLASDEFERMGAADERSFVWRAGFYDVVCMVCILIHGPDHQVALTALQLYGEDLEEYLKEFDNA